MKAARKAHGESTDVGTEEDLWGPQDGQVHVHKDKTAAVPRVNMSMPTHLEIGLLPQTTMPHDTGWCDSVFFSDDHYLILFWLVVCICMTVRVPYNPLLIIDVYSLISV